MAPSKQNAKKVAGNAKKEENANKKAAVENEKKAAKDDEEWSKGSKGKGKADDKAAKEEEARKRKAEAARLLAEEEAAAPKTVKAAPKAGAKKPTPAKAAPPPSARIPDFNLNSLPDDLDTLTASGIDDALDMLNLVNEKTDKAAVGSKAAKIETHPERRFKAAFEAYKDEQMPIIRKDYPGLRLQQYHDRLYKDFQKSPDNPFNQVSMDYNASKDEKVEALKQLRAETEQRMRGGQ